MSRFVLDAVEQLLPIPPDVRIGLRDDLPSGKAWWVSAQRTVLVAEGLDPETRHDALAHEAAHIILGHCDSPDDLHATETAAQALGEVLQRLAHAVLGLEALQRRVSALEGSSRERAGDTAGQRGGGDPRGDTGGSTSTRS